MSDFDYKASDLFDYILEIEEKEKFKRKIRRSSLMITLVLTLIIFVVSWFQGTSGTKSGINPDNLTTKSYIRISSDQFNAQAVKELYLNSGKHIIIESRHGLSNDTLSSIGEIERFSRINNLLLQAKGGTIRGRGPYIRADEMPNFPGGQASLARYLQSQLRYPDEARANRIEGDVQIRFVIKADGTVSEPEVVQGIGFGCDKEALRLISSMPRWVPGKIGGENVAVYKALSIQFQLL